LKDTAESVVAVQWDGHASAKNGKPYNQRYCWVMRLEGGRVREGVITSVYLPLIQ
jgi:ketosteroid isomerase-like protein